MRKVLLTAALACALLSTQANAQVGVHDGFSTGQGPWNGYAQPARGKYSRMHYAPASGMPPANARCGWFLGRLTGHARRSLWLAQNWAREFPRTSARPGAVVVWTRGGNKGHVAQIVAMRGNCRATVRDNRGTYDRDICRSVIAYVSV